MRRADNSLSLLRAVGDRVRETRISLGWTQFDLAQRLGVSPQKISDLELASRDIDIGLVEIVRVAKALSVPARQLLFPSPHANKPKERRRVGSRTRIDPQDAHGLCDPRHPETLCDECRALYVAATAE